MKAVPICIFLFIFSLACVCNASPLKIINHTGHDLLNLLARSPGHEYFFRLDLDPDASAEVENPRCAATIRLDSGLHLYNFSELDLADIKALSFGPDAQLTITTNNGKSRQEKGHVHHLVPRPGDPPVCNLGTFHPAMPMKDVCAVLPGELPRDDNGAIMVGMGFADLIWAARLVPEPSSPPVPTEDTLLEHMELRTALAPGAVKKVIAHFFKEGYAPWQAELPGLDMEFDENASPASQEELLLATLLRFMEKSAHSSHALRKCDQASVIFAPRKMLPGLEMSEDPETDVEIFTLVIRPCTNILLVDVAAYRGSGGR